MKVKESVRISLSLYASLCASLAALLMFGNGVLPEKWDDELFGWASKLVPQQTVKQNMVVLSLPQDIIAQWSYSAAGSATELEQFLKHVFANKPREVGLFLEQPLSLNPDEEQQRSLINYLTKQRIVVAHETFGAAAVDPGVAAKPPNYSTQLTLHANPPEPQPYARWLPRSMIPTMRQLLPSSPYAPENFFLNLPSYAAPPDNVKRTLVWQQDNRLLPDIALSLYQRSLHRVAPIWQPREGIYVRNHFIDTNMDGSVRLILNSRSSFDAPYPVIYLTSLSDATDLGSVEDKIVLIGHQDDAAMFAAAYTLLNLKNELTAFSPAWAILSEKGMIALLLLYAVLVLHRLRTGHLIYSGTLLLFAAATTGAAFLVIQHVWIPITSIIVLLFTTHSYAAYLRWTYRPIAVLTAEADEAFLKLGTYQRERGEYDQALTSLLRCTSQQHAIEQIYLVGLEYERRRQYEKALDTYQHISKLNASYKDVPQRLLSIQQMHGSINTALPLKGSQGATLLVAGSGLERPVLGRYEIEKELGRGSMGVVYLGRDPKIMRRVAIKTLSYAEFPDELHETLKTRFFREAEAAGRLTHPNIVTVHDVGDEPDLAFMAMDYVPGNSLAVYSQPGHLLPVDVVYRLMAQVAEALDYAHRQKIVHRDVKPGNIIYNEHEDLIKVTDFGIARITDSRSTRTGTILGSPSYMSPEQLKYSKVDGRADIFSLGVTFFQLLTGDLPFKGDSLASVAYQIANGKHPSPRSIRPDLPRSCVKIINRALEKQPENRFASCAEIAAAFALELEREIA